MPSRDSFGSTSPLTPWNGENTAPWASPTTANRPTFGMSIAGAHTEPPIDGIFATASSTFGTVTYETQCDGNGKLPSSGTMPPMPLPCTSIIVYLPNEPMSCWLVVQPNNSP